MIEGGATAVDGQAEPLSGSGVMVPMADAPVGGDDQVAEIRFAALAAAVREHESRRRHTAIPARPEDVALYRRLRQICGD
jgi:hypothetical protein